MVHHLKTAVLLAAAIYQSYAGANKATNPSSGEPLSAYDKKRLRGCFGMLVDTVRLFFHARFENGINKLVIFPVGARTFGTNIYIPGTNIYSGEICTMKTTKTG